MQLDELPVDLFVEWIAFLDRQDRLNLRLLSKKFLQLMDNHVFISPVEIKEQWNLSYLDDKLRPLFIKCTILFDFECTLMAHRIKQCYNENGGAKNYQDHTKIILFQTIPPNLLTGLISKPIVKPREPFQKPYDNDYSHLRRSLCCV